MHSAVLAISIILIKHLLVHYFYGNLTTLFSQSSSRCLVTLEYVGIHNKLWAWSASGTFKSSGTNFRLTLGPLQKWTNLIQLVQWQRTNFMHALLCTLKWDPFLAKENT